MVNQIYHHHIGSDLLYKLDLFKFNWHHPEGLLRTTKIMRHSPSLLGPLSWLWTFPLFWDNLDLGISAILLQALSLNFIAELLYITQHTHFLHSGGAHGQVTDRGGSR